MAYENASKVIYGNEVIMDLTGDDVTPSDVRKGVIFHDKSGTQQTGTAEIYFDDTTIVLSVATFEDTTTIVE